MFHLSKLPYCASIQRGKKCVGIQICSEVWLEQDWNKPRIKSRKEKKKKIADWDHTGLPFLSLESLALNEQGVHAGPLLARSRCLSPRGCSAVSHCWPWNLWPCLCPWIWSLQKEGPSAGISDPALCLAWSSSGLLEPLLCHAGWWKRRKEIIKLSSS